MKEMAEIFVEELTEDTRDIHHEISMAVDQSRMHMMYSNNLKVLEYSDSEPEEWSIFVDDNESDHKKVLQAMAYATLRQDLYREIEERIDLEEYQ